MLMMTDGRALGRMKISKLNWKVKRNENETKLNWEDNAFVFRFFTTLKLTAYSFTGSGILQND